MYLIYIWMGSRLRELCRNVWLQGKHTLMANSMNGYGSINIPVYVDIFFSFFAARMAFPIDKQMEIQTKQKIVDCMQMNRYMLRYSFTCHVECVCVCVVFATEWHNLWMNILHSIGRLANWLPGSSPSNSVISTRERVSIRDTMAPWHDTLALAFRSGAYTWRVTFPMVLALPLCVAIHAKIIRKTAYESTEFRII